MPSQLPSQLKTYVAWIFNNVLPGTFRRAKVDFAHHEYPIIAPLPTNKRNTQPLESSRLGGPYLYFVTDDQSQVRYVGKSLEKHVIQRWVRPGIGGAAPHYWTHTTKSGGCVFNIAKGLKGGDSKTYTLRYVPVMEIAPEVLTALGFPVMADPSLNLELIEKAMTRTLGADWNIQGQCKS